MHYLLDHMYVLIIKYEIDSVKMNFNRKGNNESEFYKSTVGFKSKRLVAYGAT